MAEESDSDSSGYVLPEQARDDGSYTDASSGYAVPQEALDDQTTTATTSTPRDSGYFSDTNSSHSTTPSDDDHDDRHDQNRNLNNDLDEGYDDTAHGFDDDGDGGDGGEDAQGNRDGHQPGPLHQHNLFPLHGMPSITSPNCTPPILHQSLQLVKAVAFVLVLVLLATFNIAIEWRAEIIGGKQQIDLWFWPYIQSFIIITMSWCFYEYHGKASTWSMLIEMYNTLHWGDLIKLLIFHNQLLDELMRQHASFQHYLLMVRKHVGSFMRSVTQCDLNV